MTSQRSFSVSPVLLFTLLALTYSFFYHAGQDNENARLEQARMIAEFGALNIDRYLNSADVITFEGVTYPNKAPGITLLAAPLWKVFHPLFESFASSSNTADHLTCHLITFSLSGLPTALIAVLLFVFLRQKTRNESFSLLLSLSYGLGSIAFPFATLLFSHQLAACLLFSALFLLYKDKPAMLPAGVLLGYSITTEYPCALAMIPLTLYGLSQTVPIRAKGVLLLGILIGLIPLFAYQTLAFGDPFYIPYSAYTEAGQKFTSHAQGFWGVSLPNSDVLYNILFSLKRGLFVVNPWFILLPFAALASLYVLLKRDDDYKRELSLSLTITIFFLLFNAGFGDSIVYWGGGASVGPRHILPMLPFVTLLIGLLPWQRIVEAVLVMLTPISMGIMLLATSTEPRVPYEYHSPVTELFWRNYIHGRVALGERGTFSDELMTDSSVSYNLSQMIGLPNEASLLPLFLLWTAALVLLFPFTQKAFRAFRALSLCMFFVLLVLPAAVRTRYIVRDEQSQGLLMTTIRGIAWESPNEPLRDPAIEGLEVVSRKVTPNVLLTPGMARTIPATPFSLEWQGYLRVDTPGDYYLGTESDDGSALIIDGDLLVQNWGSHATKRIMKRKYLAEGTYPITVRYYNAQAEGAMRLLWSPPFSHVHTIPPDVLRITKPKGREHT